jgi:peptide/nickel transport system substrate-binding protein
MTPVLTRRALLALTAAPLLAAADAAPLSIAVSRDIQGQLDPVSRLGALESNILRAVCPGLIRSTATGWEPALAAHIDQPSDTMIGFTLRDGLSFSGGFGPVTSEDVAFSFQRFRHPGPDGALPPYASDWAALDGVELTGRLSGIIHLKSPAPMLWTTVLPDGSGCIISRRALEQGGYRSDRRPMRIIGAGAYTFDDWIPDQRIMLRGAATAPFPAIVLRPVRETMTAELALRADEVQFAAVPAEDLASVRQAPDTKTIDQPATNLVWLGINVDHTPFDDVRVRQAIRAAIDIDAVLAGSWDGAVPQAFAPIAPGLPGHWSAAPRRARDVAQAKAWLAEAGHPNGFPARLLVLNQPAYQSAAVILQAMLRDIGIRLELDIRDPGAYWAGGGPQVQLALQRFGGKPDPGFLLQWFTSGQVGSWNWQRWRDPDYDQLVSRAAATPDGAARDALYIAAQQRMDESAAFVWLTHEVASSAFRSWLRPAVLANGEDWQLDQFSKG